MTKLIRTLTERTLSQEEETSVDPQLLFQPLLLFTSNSNLNLDELLKYELSIYSPALFDKQGLLNPPNKSQVSEAIAKYCPYTLSLSGAHVTVFDGGSLHQTDGEVKLITAKWQNMSTMLRIFLTKLCFDRYNSISTKYVTHARHTKGISGPTGQLPHDI